MVGNPKPPLELRVGYKDKKRLGQVAALGCVACKIKRAPKASKLEVHHISGASACGWQKKQCTPTQKEVNKLREQV